MLLTRAILGFSGLFAVIVTALFGSEGSQRDARAWATIAVLFGCAAMITVWL